jgi:ABC-type microcin C transport system duplicated ATPase subunit YejF
MADLRGNQLAMIFQEPMTALNPVLTVGEQLCEPLIRHRGESPKPHGSTLSSFWRMSDWRARIA